MCLNNQSHTALTSLNFSQELCDTQSPFKDNIGMNEKCRKLNPSCCKKSVTSLIKQHFFRGKLKIAQFKSIVLCKTC